MIKLPIFARVQFHRKISFLSLQVSTLAICERFGARPWAELQPVAGERAGNNKAKPFAAHRKACSVSCR